MATLLLKKSYQIKTLKEIPFQDLWGNHGVFTTMRLIGKPLKIIFLKNHLKNIINSSKAYNIYKVNLLNNLKKILKYNLIINRSYNHLLRLAITKDVVSISIRRRLSPDKDFKLKFYKHKRAKAQHKNLNYKKILKNMKKINTKKYDLALINKNRIYETGTANLLFIKNNKIYSPKDNFYKGITLKYISKQIKINFKDILIKNLKDYDEIILVGSGKGIVAATKIEEIKWARKSTKYFKILKNLYKTAVTKCPLYYS